MSKNCNTCDQTKPLDEFHRSSANKDGYRNQCKQCSSEYARKRREVKREHIKEVGRQYYERTKAHKREKTKARAADYAKQYSLLDPHTTYKPCKNCANTKALVSFPKRATARDGRRATCKACSNARKAIYRESNRERVRAANRKWRQNNPERVRENNKQFSAKNPHYYRDRRRNDPQYRLRKTISAAVCSSLSERDTTKRGQSTFDILPYTLNELRQHLESQFDKHMTWENYGAYWHVDHIYPQSKFDFASTDCDAFRLCWSLANLRPLEAIENMQKGDKITESFRAVFGIDKPEGVL